MAGGTREHCLAASTATRREGCSAASTRADAEAEAADRKRAGWQRVLNRLALGSCGAAIGPAEDWAAAGPYPAGSQTMQGPDKWGGFDAQYQADPDVGDGVLDISQAAAVTFKDTMVLTGGVIAPHPDLPVTNPATDAIAVEAARLNAIADAGRRTAALALYQWTVAEKAPWLAALRPLIENAWSGKHQFFLNKPSWQWLGAAVQVRLDIGERAKAASDHMNVETYKTPPGEGLQALGIQQQVDRRTRASAFDQEMRIDSTTLTPRTGELLSRHVEFGYGSAVLTPAATRTLDAFITRFNGNAASRAHKAHEEIRVDVIGHASASGDERANQRLSLRRAEAVREYLRSHGFVNMDTRVHVQALGETGADISSPNRADDQRVDLLVDGGEHQVIAVHEWGHAFGLHDEYDKVGTDAGHNDMASKMTDFTGASLPGAVREHTGGLMSMGNQLLPRHYATFHNALQTVTAQSPWSLGAPLSKGQVLRDCEAIKAPGDFPVPAQDEGGERMA